MSTVEVSRHPGDAGAHPAKCCTATPTATPLHRELSLGDDRWFAANAVRLEHSRNRDCLGYVLVFHEVSELKRLERIRADFVANVSHEMRTPLTAIQGYAETLLHNPPQRPPHGAAIPQHRYARHSERLGRLIDDLLALSDLEMGNVNVRMNAGGRPNRCWTGSWSCSATQAARRSASGCARRSSTETPDNPRRRGPAPAVAHQPRRQRPQVHPRGR